jgi:hypothetical protein
MDEAKERTGVIQSFYNGISAYSLEQDELLKHFKK